MKETSRPTDKNTWICYSQRMAGWLMQRGFVLIDIAPDNKHPCRNVFFFNNTAQLHDAVGEYMTAKK